MKNYVLGVLGAIGLCLLLWLILYSPKRSIAIPMGYGIEVSTGRPLAPPDDLERDGYHGVRLPTGTSFFYNGGGEVVYIRIVYEKWPHNPHEAHGAIIDVPPGKEVEMHIDARRYAGGVATVLNE